jgi:protein SCO1/2
MMNGFRLIAWIGVAAVAAAAAWLWLERWQGAAPEREAAVSGDFELVDQDHRSVPASWFREGPLAVFFGFTSCPDVCPTTLATLSRWLEALGEEEAAALKVAFVSIDPERDTPDLIGNYVGHFDSRITGITGEPAALRALAGELGAEFEVSAGEGRYEVSHSASIYLIDRDGRFVGALKENTLLEIAVERLRALIRDGGGEPAS